MNTFPPHVRSVLDVSCIHLPAHVRSTLDEIEDGWLLWVPPDPLAGMEGEPSVTTLEIFARALGCTYVILAHDGFVTDGLPVYETNTPRPSDVVLDAANAAAAVADADPVVHTTINDHTNELGDWCPWSMTDVAIPESAVDGYRCAATCPNSGIDPDVRRVKCEKCWDFFPQVESSGLCSGCQADVESSMVL